MTQDSYQYQVLPLPKPPVIGDQTYSPTQIAVDQPDPFSTGVSSPFENSHTPDSPVTGGGGGGGTPAELQYITDEVDVIVGTGSAGSSDSTTINTGATGDNFLNLSSDDPVDSTGKGALFLGANIYKMSVQDYRDIESGVSPGDLGQVQLRQLDVCHMGAAGYRSFFCSEAYAP